jgi:hypothetical protein
MRMASPRTIETRAMNIEKISKKEFPKKNKNRNFFYKITVSLLGSGRTISSESPALPQILQFVLMLLKARPPECWNTLLVPLLASFFHPSRDLRLAS